MRWVRLEFAAILLVWGCSGSQAAAPALPSIAQIGAMDAHVKFFAVQPQNAGLLEITAGPDGALWFTEQLASQIGRLDNKHFKYFRTPTANAKPSGITVGSDNALWFTEGIGAIGRVTTSGSITEFPVHHPAYAITSGPDGDLWFTENAGSRNWIGRMTPSGGLTEFAVPSNNRSLEAGIAVGRDGWLWSTLMQANEVVKCTTFGKIRVYKNHDRDSQLFPIVANGNFFIGEAHGLAQLTPQGVFKEYPLEAGSDVFGITQGPMHSIWFGVNQGNYIGTVVNNRVKLYKTGPTSANGLWDITLGSDGNLWFTDTVGNRIGRFIPPT